MRRPAAPGRCSGVIERYTRPCSTLCVPGRVGHLGDDAGGLDPEVGLLDRDRAPGPHELGVGDRQRRVDRQARVADRHHAAGDGSPRRTRTESTRSGSVLKKSTSSAGTETPILRASRETSRWVLRASLPAAWTTSCWSELSLGVAQHAQPPGGEHHLAAGVRQRLLGALCGRRCARTTASRPASRVAVLDEIDAFRSACATVTSSPAARTAAWSAARSAGEVSGGAVGEVALRLDLARRAPCSARRA